MSEVVVILVLVAVASLGQSVAGEMLPYQYAGPAQLYAPDEGRLSEFGWRTPCTPSPGAQFAAGAWWWLNSSTSGGAADLQNGDLVEHPEVGTSCRHELAWHGGLAC
jgi:hypothetical protein